MATCEYTGEYMEDQALKQLIEAAIKEAKQIEAEQSAENERLDAEYMSLLAAATARQLAETDGIPSALLPYCEATDNPSQWGLEHRIQHLKDGWAPDCFAVNAPGLAEITFKLRRGSRPDERSDRNYPDELCVETANISDRWSVIIAAAAEKFQAQQAYARERAERAVRRKAERQALALLEKMAQISESME
jgi:hypothetical protein